MTLIRKPSELTIQTKIKALIYGQAGTGKSTLALSAPKPLMLDFDGGVHRVNYSHQTPTVQISRWEDCEEVLKEDLSAFESLLIDTGGKMLDYMAEYRDWENQTVLLRSRDSEREKECSASSAVR